MKYLYLIIRHCFPRKHWTLLHETKIIRAGHAENSTPVGRSFTLQDQFGNIKTVNIRF
jgi:hypothetical protein